MPLVRRIQRRGSNIVVEAHGEVLFAAGGDVGRWTNRFSQRVRAFTQAEAPSNKRPRWGHYGKPLKQTFTASTTYQPGRMRVYSAIGSSAPHAYYVDQGTGVYNGSGPYPAKVLPPWQRGEASLYEATWRPGGPGTRRVAPVMIKGQKGQGFFDAGLRRAFQSMRMRSFQTPGDPQITNVLNSVPTGIINFLGNTPADGAFVASLEEWRAWRDEAWERNDLLLGRQRLPANRIKPRPPRSVAKNLAAYNASVEASKRRAEAQRQRLAAERARREEGRRKQAERDRKLREANALRRGNMQAQKEARQFYETIRRAYPNATFRSTTLPDGVIAYRVTYTQADGDVVRKTWAHGYATD
jgi:hypothetical protein